MKLKLNREFAMRHGFVALLLAAMGGWFAYDGYVTYPSMTPEALYEQIEHSKPPSPEAAQKVYENAIPRQKQLMGLCFLGSLVVAFGLWRAWRFSFEYDESGFSFGGVRHAFGDVASIDDSRWKKKGIMSLKLSDGRKITLDAWHNTGVEGFREILNGRG
jgi:hypothetical protein